MKRDNRYIVIGGCLEHMAHLDCTADSEEEALAKWDAAFPDFSRTMFSPEAVSLEKYPDMERHWTYDGDRYYSGGYRYTY